MANDERNNREVLLESNRIKPTTTTRTTTTCSDARRAKRTVAHIPRGLDVDLFKRPILRFAQWIAKLVVVNTFECVARVDKVRGRARDGHGHQDVGRRGQTQGFRATPVAAGCRTRIATPVAQRLTRITIKAVRTGFAKRRARVAHAVEP
jgi:hypothetical protein